MTARREEIEAAVAAYDQANPRAPLGPIAARLLRVMFPASNVCQRGLDDIAASGFSRRTLPMTLWQLVRAGFLFWQQSAGADVYRLHLPPLVRR
jgi:hypothetical protein